jgi:hypothetical protein
MVESMCQDACLKIVDEIEVIHASDISVEFVFHTGELKFNVVLIKDIDVACRGGNFSFYGCRVRG